MRRGVFGEDWPLNTRSQNTRSFWWSGGDTEMRQDLSAQQSPKLITLSSRVCSSRLQGRGVISRAGTGVMVLVGCLVVGRGGCLRAELFCLVRGAEGWWWPGGLCCSRPRVLDPRGPEASMPISFRIRGCMACGSGWPLNSNHTAADGLVSARNRARRVMELQGPRNEGYPSVGSRVL